MSHTRRLIYKSIANSRQFLFRAKDKKPTGKKNWSYFNSTGKDPFIGKTIGQVLDDAALMHSDKEAVVFCNEKLRKNFSQLKTDADKLAAGLLAIGLKKGDRIGIWCPNYYEWIVTLYATAKAGLILVLVNPAYQPREVEYCINKVGMRALVAAESFKTQDYYKMLSTIVPSLPNSKPGEVSDRLLNFSHVIMISKKQYGGAFSFEEVFNGGQKQHYQQLIDLEDIIQFDDPVNIQFTSGTTGFPKGVTLTHFTVINNNFRIGKRMAYNEKPHRICIPVPLYHAFGCMGGSLCSILYGACQVYPSPSYEGKATAQAVHDEKCTCLYGTPTMFIDLLNLPDISKYNFSSCKSGMMGGATCPVPVLMGARDKLQMLHISVGYGTTECSPGISATLLGDTVEKNTTTVGKVIDQTEVKLVDPITLRIVPIGEIGEVWVRGYFIMLEYWNDPGGTSEAITKDRWYRTGDLAIADDEGYLKIVGRIKDMIIRGGENIYPREIEEFLHTNPKIAEAYVIGVPDQRMGEELCAWIRLKPNEQLTDQEVRDFCKGQIAHIKIPRYIKFVDKFPLTITGKVQKFLMREQSTTELKLDAVKSNFTTKEEN